MKAMFAGGAAIIIIGVAAFFILGAMEFSVGDVYSGINVRLE
jgi:hypothetical protein